jgi:hypothetical protein
MAALTWRPGEQSAAVAGDARRGARLSEAPVAVHEQGAGNLRHAQIEKGEDEDLVPEDVSAVRFAVQAARRDTDVEVETVHGNRLQQVEHVQAQHQGDAVGAGDRIAVQGNVDAAPKVGPRLRVRTQKFLEAGGSGDGAAHFQTALGDGAVAGGVQGDDLLHGERPSAHEVEGPLPGNLTVLGPGTPVAHRRRLAFAEHARARRFRDADLGLRRLHLQVDGFVIDRAGVQRLQVRVVEVAVTLDTGVQHLSVEGGTDVDRPRPVLRHQGQLEGGEVWLVHVQQAPAVHAGLAALAVVEAHGAPPSMRKVSGSQFGTLTRSSFSTTRPAMSVRRRLYTPAT